MVIYSFHITKLLRDADTGEVKRVYSKAFASEDGLTMSVDISNPLEPSNPNSFIPFDELTEEQVLSWITDKDSVQIYLNALLEEAKYQEVDYDSLPWGS